MNPPAPSNEPLFARFQQLKTSLLAAQPNTSSMIDGLLDPEARNLPVGRALEELVRFHEVLKVPVPEPAPEPVVPTPREPVRRELHGTKGTSTPESVDEMISKARSTPFPASKPKSPFWAIHDGVLDRGDLDGVTKLVVLSILRYAKHATLTAYPSRATVARGASARVSTVDRHLLIAKEKGILDWGQRRTGSGLVNEYVLNTPDQWVADSGPAPSPWSRNRQNFNGRVASPGGATPTPDEQEG
jgi:hypothetical protein